MKTTSLQVRLHTVANLPIALEFVQVLILEIKHSAFSNSHLCWFCSFSVFVICAGGEKQGGQADCHQVDHLPEAEKRSHHQVMMVIKVTLGKTKISCPQDREGDVGGPESGEAVRGLACNA